MTQGNFFNQETELSRLRRETREAAKAGGCLCPVCGQYVKVYKRSVNSTMAGMLIRAYKKFGVNNRFHVSDIGLGKGGGSGDFSKLKYWGLINEYYDPEEENNGGKTQGYWKVTPSAAEFVNRAGTIQKYALVYNGKCLSLEGGYVDIDQCLGEKFNYHELMERVI